MLITECLVMVVNVEGSVLVEGERRGLKRIL